MCFMGHHFHPTWLTAVCEEWEVHLYSVHIKSLQCDTWIQCEVGFGVPQLPRLMLLTQPTVASKDLVKTSLIYTNNKRTNA